MEDKQKVPPAFLLMDGNIKAFPADINNLECPQNIANYQRFNEN